MRGKKLLVEYEGFQNGYGWGMCWGCSTPASIAAIAALVLGLFLIKEIKETKAILRKLEEKS